MEIMIEEVKRVDDGTHQGVIIDVQYRDLPYKYTDLLIEFEHGKKVRASYPTCITPESKLGRLLKEFGAILKIGAKIDPDKWLLQKPCQFITLTETTPRGTFPKVIPQSLKPLKKD